jgi:hypothetical protein
MRSLIVGSIFAVTLTGCGCPRSQPIPAVAEEAADWKRYTTADSTCSAVFPARPTIDETGITLHQGMDYYSLTQATAPPEFAELSDEEILAELRDRQFAGEWAEGFQLVAEEKFVLQGAPGHRWHYQSRPDPFISHFMLKIVVRRGEMFLIGAATFWTDKSLPDMKRFLDSFQFENAKP